MNEEFKAGWNTTNKKFTPSTLEWLCWCGQPLLYDGGLCVNRTVEEHQHSLEQKGCLML
jgi:hypothetical protein